MRTYDLSTVEGVEAFGDLVGHRVARAVKFGLAFGVGVDRLRTAAREDALRFARTAVDPNMLPKTSQGALNVAVRYGVVFG